MNLDDRVGEWYRDLKRRWQGHDGDQAEWEGIAIAAITGLAREVAWEQQQWCAQFLDEHAARVEKDGVSISAGRPEPEQLVASHLRAAAAALRTPRMREP